MIRKNFVPFTKVSAKSVQALLDEMRGGKETASGTASSVETEGTNNQNIENQEVSVGKKKGLVPDSHLAVDPEIQRMRELFTSGKTLCVDSEGTISPADEVKAKDTEFKAKTIPNATVSADVQWYMKDKDLLEAEVVAMHDFKPDARYTFFNDGRMCWCVRFTPTVAGKKTRTYNLALVYDTDHPKARYGSSVRAYLISPTIEDLQRIVNNTPGITNKTIPHLIKDNVGDIYLCTADTTNCVDSLEEDGVTSAATSLRFAMRWINIFEAGLRDPFIWDKFHKHDEI